VFREGQEFLGGRLVNARPSVSIRQITGG